MSWRKKKFNKHSKSVFAQNKVPITSPRKIFTYQNETTEGEGTINGAAMTIEKGRGGESNLLRLL
jgi:hypothetical protein